MVRANATQQKLAPLVDSSAIDHDIGFVMYCSFGNGYRLTNNPAYKQTLLRAADTLANLYNPNVGTILSWPRPVPGTDWPLRHNTIMDNMINLELLFWASRNGGGQRLYDMAVSHAETTMKNHFRPDYTSYHVVVYDTATGKKVKGMTHQGYADSSMWARGQAWAIYGYTMLYRETRLDRYRQQARQTADFFLNHPNLPADKIPYWDFNAPGIPKEERDASAAAIVASALLELQQYCPAADAKRHRQAAEQMLVSLSSPTYRAVLGDNHNFLIKHCVAHKPAQTEVDAPLVYADYYYLEALLRYDQLK